ncbi:MAG TPA: response regulator transcription factor [Clostridiaceae bacterium]|nr:response regulator transcription factor [Clostridiaceae bacterium]
MTKMLIAYDKRQIVSVLEAYAKNEGFSVTKAYDGMSALAAFEADIFDIILLDVMMPGMDGFSLCRKIREKSQVPIIMVTARGEDFERIMGLDIGADDYIVKPFSPGEVMARVRAVLRRLDPHMTNENDAPVKTMTYDNLTLNPDSYQTSISEQEIILTKKEFEILWTLLTNSPKVFTRDNLLNSLWGFDYEGDSRTVDSHIKRLRAKLDQVSHPNWEIKTIWGVGYKFEEKTDDN